MTEEVLFTRRGKSGVMTLNRPEALNALTLNMVRLIKPVLSEWAMDASIDYVVIEGAGEKGFCAGGDIRALHDWGKAGAPEATGFYREEYQLNHQIKTFPKPYIALIDGITMGGGVGIALPCKYRVVTENTRFAMPESGIGLFPDVGGGWHLSRLGGRLGQFLALTGARLDGAECVWAGIATHYLPAEKLAEAKARIIEHPDRIGGILSELSTTAPPARLEENAALIKKHFASDRYEDILASLEADDSEWAAKELATLRGKSPQTCKVALRQLSESEKLESFADNMRMEYRIASRVLTRPDFAEGVRAVIVDKTNDPQWNPARPEDVSEELLDSIFAPLPEGEEWTPLG